MTPEERMARGQQAQAAQAFMADIFDGVRTHLLNELVEANDPEAILEGHRSIRTLATIRKAIELVISDGQIAASIIAARDPT